MLRQTRIRCLREESEDEPGGSREIDVEEEQEQSEEPDRAILCGSCGAEITSDEHRIDVDGKFEHTFANPAGILYTIGCFDEAPGCGAFGEETDEFTWFPGYTWQIVLCRDCSSHLGWRYWSSDREFYGLILARLDGV